MHKFNHDKEIGEKVFKLDFILLCWMMRNRVIEPKGGEVDSTGDLTPKILELEPHYDKL